MNRSGELAPDSSSRSFSAPAPADAPRNERTTGKGRRRRAAAEQRRIEQQRWGQYLCEKDGDEDLVLAPAAPRRQGRRRSSARRDQLEEELYFVSHDDLDIALGTALSLSMAENPSAEIQPAAPPSDNMSYENLVELENVRCVASSELVASLTRAVSQEECSGSCVICQNDYVCGDKLVNLPCEHQVHESCGSEWLLNYSKLCPVCKADISESI